MESAATQVRSGGIELAGFVSLAERSVDVATPWYAAFTLMLGSEGPQVSRMHVIEALAARGYRSSEALDVQLGVRRTYGADVVAAWMGC